MGAELEGVEARAAADPLAAGGLLERIVAWAGQVVGTPNGYICLIEADSGEMVLRVGTGAYADFVGLRMLKGEGLSGRVWETGDPLAIPDYSRWEGRVPQMATDAFRAVLGVPLVSGGEVSGVIGLSFSEPGREFSEDQVQQVSRFAEVASIALDNARLYAAAQQELVERQKAEGRFRSLVEEIPAIVYSEEFEVGGARQFVNRQVEALFGFTPEEASRANFWKTIVHPDDLERVLAEEARCEQTGEPFRMEYRFYTRSGEVKWVRDQCVLVHDEAGTPLFWQGVCIDITDTKRALEHEREVAQRLLTMHYVGFDGRAHTGQMVVHHRHARGLVGVFRELYEARFPIRRMQLIDAYGGDDNRSMAADNTSAYNCRTVAGKSTFSDHAYGAAVDIKPVENPYVTTDGVLPAAGRRFVDVNRSLGADAPRGVIVADDVVVRAFARIGWKWGGVWTEADYQHFHAP